MAKLYSDPVKNVTAAYLPGLMVENYVLKKIGKYGTGLNRKYLFFRRL
jgi:hypothetical protein